MSYRVYMRHGSLNYELELTKHSSDETGGEISWRSHFIGKARGEINYLG